MMKIRVWMFTGIVSAGLLIPAKGEEPAQEDSGNVVEITRVSSSSTPIMKNDSLLYSLDLIFKEFPAKFWSYSDSVNHLTTIEIFGNEVRAPAINLPASCPVTKIQIKNHATKMALSGQVATISFAIEPGWNVDVAQIDSNDIHLRIGKKMEVREIKEELGKKKR